MSTDTAEQKIIQAAEELFAEQGFEVVSLRDVTGKAGVNVASVNYYFRSKEGLINTVFAQRLVPINQARLARLKAAQKEFSSEKIPVEVVLNAFFQPLVDRVSTNRLNERLFAKFMGRLMSRNPGKLPAEVRVSFEPVFEKFVEVLTDSCPHLTKSEILWRLNHSFGVMIQSLLHRETFVALCQEQVELPDLSVTIRSVTRFCVAGFLEGGVENLSNQDSKGTRQGELF